MGNSPIATALRAWLWLLALSWFAFTGTASEAAATFEQANKLYEQAKFGEAAAVYEQILARGHVSPALLFNLGNAQFKANQVGRAIASYQCALRLAPRDADIRANLAFARAAANGGVAQPRSVGSRLRVLTSNEVAAITMLCLWTWLGTLIAMQLRPDWRDPLRRLAWSTGLPAILFGLGLAATAWWNATHTPVVVIAREAVVRLGPFEESQSAFVLREGAEIVATDRKADWFRVHDAAGRTGWLQFKTVSVP